MTYKHDHSKQKKEEEEQERKPTKNSTTRGIIVVRPMWNSHSVANVVFPIDFSEFPARETKNRVKI
jgi:hypothetical protein